MDSPILRRPKHWFDTRPRPETVTFDDGVTRRRNLPWKLFVEACWRYDQPDTIRFYFGEWLIVVIGHNLRPLLDALGEPILSSISAQPQLVDKPENVADTFASEIRFLKIPGAVSRPGGQLDLDFPSDL